MGSPVVSAHEVTEALFAEVIAESRQKIELKDYSGALQIIATIYDSGSPTDRVPLDGLKADCFLALGDNDSALGCYERILENQSDAPYWVHVGYANTLERQGQNDKAIEQMSVALKKEFSYPLAERVIKLSQFSSSPTTVHKAVVDLSLEYGSEAQAIDIGELLILEGISSESGRLFESLMQNCETQVPLITRMVQAHISVGEARLAIKKIEAWKSANVNDTRLDALYEFCLESRILDSVNGLPCILVEHGRTLKDFELRINGCRVRKGLERYSRPLLEDTVGLKNTQFKRYLIVFPECYLDTKKDTYSLQITELTGSLRGFTSSYSVTKVITDERELNQGDFEYLGGNRIHGWYHSKTDKVARLALHINGEFIEEIKVNKERPDIASIYGTDCLNCGFSYSWDSNLIVDELELRNTVTGLPVLCTPIKVQRLENAVRELENALARNTDREGSKVSSRAIEGVFESLRQMPQISVEHTQNYAELARSYEDGVSVVIPVYDGLNDVKRCLSSLLSSDNAVSFEILCVNDCSPDLNVKDYLHQVEKEHECISVINSEINRGFVKTVNKGLLARAYKDVIILNSDTVVPENFVDRLSAAHQLDKQYGVISPLSNNATIFSFPITLEDNKLSEFDEIYKVDSILRQNALEEMYAMPTGHGFCMFVAGEVLESVGTLNEEEWGLGYGEENDFCQRVKMHGWKIGAYYGMYVGHVGSVSFGNEQRETQISKNLKRLNEIYPEYDKLIQQHIIKEKDSRLARNRLQIINFRRENNPKDVLFVSHSLGGGTSEYINRCAASLGDENVRSVTLTTDDGNIVLCDQHKTLNCIYRFDEIAEVRTQLELLDLSDVILNSIFNFPSELFEKIKDIAGHYTVVIHDYSWVCPRINLIDATGAYCGMPSSEVCVKCVEVSGTHESFKSEWKSISTGMDLWLTKNKALLENARQVIAPSKDAADRIRKKFENLRPNVKYHSDAFKVSAEIERFTANTVEEQVVAVFGMIGDHKGMALFKQLSWLLSSRHAGVKLVFFGTMSEYDWLEGYSNVKCTGEYNQDNLASLIAQEKPTVSLFLSMWPETYCYALTDSIKHGVYPIAFDIGAFSERMEIHNFGTTVPFDTDSESLYRSIVDVICSEKFKLAKASNIKGGVDYSRFSAGYLEVDSSSSESPSESKANSTEYS